MPPGPASPSSTRHSPTSTFPGEDPIGKKYGDGDLAPDSIKEIVGIVDNIRESALDEEIWPAEYKAHNQDADSYYRSHRPHLRR